MKFTSPVYSAVSGSIAGITYSHNRGGLYTRRRAVPVNTATAAQAFTRGAFQSAIANWRNTLTQQQRDDWEVYAANTPVTDKLGQTLQLNGQQMYVRCVSPRYTMNAFDGALSIPIVADAPTEFGGTPLTIISSVLDVSDDQIQMVVTAGDEWRDTLGGALLVQIGLPQNASINTYGGPFRLFYTLAGSTAMPPSTTVVATPLPFTFAAGQKWFARVRALAADGRISAPVLLSGIAQA